MMGTDSVRFDQYLLEVQVALATHKGWRQGQAFFNVLTQYKPALAERVRSSAKDPFYQDDRIDKFLKFIGEEWEA